MNLAPQYARRFRGVSLRMRLALAAALASSAAMSAQDVAPVAPSGPIAIVPMDSGATVTGALQVTAGKTLIAASGSVTSTDKTTEVVLPRRGVLRVCASTTVKLAADTSVPEGETPGLMMALDHGAIEASFATARNSDILLTPDFRILIGGPGAADVKVRLGQHGDTCVDNPLTGSGQDAPYVLVTSVFDGGVYRVQPGQRVMFQHGSLQEVVDQEKEPCGCPEAARPGSNEFPAAQSAGLAPLEPTVPAQAATAAAPAATPAKQTPSEPLVYQGQAQTPPDVPSPRADSVAQPSPVPAPAAKSNTGFFHRVGRFFKRLFGAE